MQVGGIVATMPTIMFDVSMTFATSLLDGVTFALSQRDLTSWDTTTLILDFVTSFSQSNQLKNQLFNSMVAN